VVGVCVVCVRLLVPTGNRGPWTLDRGDRDHGRLLVDDTCRFAHRGVVAFVSFSPVAISSQQGYTCLVLVLRCYTQNESTNQSINSQATLVILLVYLHWKSCSSISIKAQQNEWKICSTRGRKRRRRPKSRWSKSWWSFWRWRPWRS
jgi:hypothetical protein